jgi:hypothetical protein
MLTYSSSVVDARASITSTPHAFSHRNQAGIDLKDRHNHVFHAESVPLTPISPKNLTEVATPEPTSAKKRIIFSTMKFHVEFRV